MPNFAQLDENNNVVNVIVADTHKLNAGTFGDPATFVQTSYNTRAGEHSRGRVPLRKNYAGIGYTYDPVRDAFIPPRPDESWTLNEQTCTWEPPEGYTGTGAPA